MTVPLGISSDNRILPSVDGEDFVVARSQGARLIDSMGRSFVDYAMAMGANLLGHAHPGVRAACIAALESGSMPGFPHHGEEAAGQALSRVSDRLSRVTFLTTGSEAVHLACRIARRRTGRHFVAKVVGGYDGAVDELLFGLAGSQETESSNIRRVKERIALFRVNSMPDLEQLFQERGNELAAILIEPLVGNAGCLVPERSYLERLQELATANGTMIIADEVLVGLRLGMKLVSETLGLKPDLVTMGKAIGSGVAVAAVLGTPDAFDIFNTKKLVRYGTYHGNPLAMAAVSATLSVLESASYSNLFAYGSALRQLFAQSFAEEGISVSTSGFDSVFSIWFAPSAPRDYDEARALLRPDLALRLHESLRRHGVLVMPSPWGRLFVSFAHGDTELDVTRKAVAEAARAMASSLAHGAYPWPNGTPLGRPVTPMEED